ncbi:MAG: sugar phosphate isomerase/epimerase [Lachnospiraceae bacterium]|nr:sugar phosphate isomerase/epimerase [Lachnospiraceae bacterium]
MQQLHIIPDKKRMEETLELAEEYHAVFEYNDFFHPAVLDDQKKIDELISFYVKQPRDRSRDTMHGAFLDVTIHSEDSMIRQASGYRIRQSMEIARDMGLRGVVFHTGRLYGFRDEQYIRNWLDVNEAFFGGLLQEYPKQQIFMENMFDEAPDILQQLAKRLEHEPRFGVCLDYAHAAVTDIAGEQWVEALAPYIRHMHINDNDRINDLHQEIGAGKIDWQAFDSQMRRFQVASSVLIEMKDLGRQRRSMEYLKKNNLYPFAQRTD